jgi:hypothetical protein
MLCRLIFILSMYSSACCTYMLLPSLRWLCFLCLLRCSPPNSRLCIEIAVSTGYITAHEPIPYFSLKHLEHNGWHFPLLRILLSVLAFTLGLITCLYPFFWGAYTISLYRMPIHKCLCNPTRSSKPLLSVLAVFHSCAHRLWLHPLTWPLQSSLCITILPTE